jgi:superfamily I DNA and/or RNA helicase
VKSIFGSKEQNINEFTREYSLSERNNAALLSSILVFAKWLKFKHLEGFVFSGWGSLSINSKQQLKYNASALERPIVHFERLIKAEKESIEFRATTESKGIIERIGDAFSQKLVVTNSDQVPEKSIGHFDARSNIYQLGLLLVDLFSNCNRLEIEELRELITSENPNFRWSDIQLQKIAKACLAPQPSNRSSIDEVINALKSISLDFSDSGNTPSSSYQNVLKAFKSSLLDFSGRNALFSFRENSQYIRIEKEIQELIKTGANWQFEIDSTDSTLNKLHQIRRKQNQMLREKGEDGLLLISHFLKWKNLGEELRSPFLISNANIKYTKDFKFNYSLEFDAEVLDVNEMLRIYFKEQFNFSFPKVVSVSAVDDFIEETKKQLEAQGAEVIGIESQPTLGVFNYHNISIASDYKHLIRQEANPLNLNLLGFEKSVETHEEPKDLRWNAHFVLPADPSQEKALTCAKSKSLVIEGPPGTGKSQTIANVLAQSIAQNEKVLFVSEKRAALDVVYNRLDQAGIGELALLVHNARKEKKEIIQSIASAYHRLGQPLERDAILGKNLASWNLEEAFETIDKYYKTVRTKRNGFSLNELFLKDKPTEIAFEEEWVPDLGDWLNQKDDILKINSLLQNSGSSLVWNENAFSNFDARAISIADHPSTLVSYSIQKAKSSVNALKALDNKLEIELNIGDLLQIRSLAKSLKWLLERNLVKLILDDNPLKSSYEKLRDQYFSKQALIQKRKAKTEESNFEEVSLRELESALFKCENNSGSSELKKFVKAFVTENEWFVDDIKSILKNAIHERKNEIQLTELKAKFQSQFKTSDPDNFIEQVSLLQDLSDRMQYHLVAFYDLLNQKRFPDALLREFLQNDEPFSQLESAGYVLNTDFRSLRLAEFEVALKTLNKWTFSVETEQAIKLYNSLKPNLKYCLDKADIPILDLEQAAIKRELHRAYLANPELETFNSKKLNQLFGKLNVEYEEWLKWNSWKLLDLHVLAFQRLIQLSETPAAKLQNEEKQEKWSFKKGIRILRNEIDKERAHKTLRELVHTDAKNALDVLKPLYLMSPTAVAETFPCEKELFDVVVFDEASQLRLEEVLPIVHRAKRVVVVGDSEQLPPTDFFRSNAIQAETADQLQFSSFLMAAKAAFKSEQLTWHYRSMSQELIQFSNAAFYKNSLKVFPSFKAPKPALKSLRVEGVYENRQNQVEAKSLVDHFANLLKNDRKSSFAIITLSEAQLETIEFALDEKRKVDAAFNQLMEREEARFENGAFEGLLLKNLENMQGEERDIVLISIGYGFDKEGKFRQNFGPIMREGGDRRLNVLFSRAKAQMQVFHSFDPADLSNDNNVGIWTLKQFLKYVKAVETENIEQTKNIIKLMSRSQVKTIEEKMEQSNAVLTILQKNADLKPILVTIKDEHLHYQQIENDLETSTIYELEASEANTWHEFFVAKRVLENRGFEVKKVSTQEVSEIKK